MKSYLDGSYLAVDRTAPFQWSLEAATGSHVLRVRAYDVAGARSQVDVPFSVSAAEQVSPVPAPDPTASAQPSSGPTPVPTAPPVSDAGPSTASWRSARRSPRLVLVTS